MDAISSNHHEFSEVIGQEVMCPVCLEEFREPKILPCAHNVCEGCLEKMVSVNRKECPVCRTSIIIPKGGVTCLQTNAVLVRIVDAALRRKAKIEIQQSLERGKPLVELMAKKISDLDKVLSEMAVNMHKVERKIHEKADKLVAVIRKQEGSLCSEVKIFHGKRQEIFKQERKKLKELHSDTLCSVQDAEAILKQSLSDATKVSDIATALTQQVEKVTMLNSEKSVQTDVSELVEKLEFRIDTEATCIGLLQDDKFGKLNKKIMDTTSSTEFDGNESGNLSDGYVPSDTRVSFTHIDQLSDADLYGHSNGSPSSKGKENYSPMEMQDTVLAPPRPPPRSPHHVRTYHHATQLPGNNWVMFQSQGGETDLQEQKRPDTTTVLNKTIPGFSAMNIGENGPHGIYKSSSETNVNQLLRGSSEVGVRGENNITSQRRKSLSKDIEIAVYANKRYDDGQYVDMGQTKREHQFLNIVEQPSNPDKAACEGSDTNCDLCRLAATLICKECLKPTCHRCLYLYKQDLCSPTKREYKFENVMEQPSDEAAGKGPDAPWACESCTFLNSTKDINCSLCETPRGVNQVEFPKSGSKMCAKCTFGNEEGTKVCEMCACSFGLDFRESYI